MNILITGGAGFIGSNIIESLLVKHQINKLRILDNLSTGFIENINPFLSHPNVEFLEGDIRDKEKCAEAVRGMNAVCHQAALGSVPRSIQYPLLTHDNNVNGFINILNATKEAGIQRFVYASSSSVYGDLNESPKVESRIGNPLSPYAVSKRTNELYADVFARCYGMSIAGFRYFNVFGPRQDPNGPYAAVIPLFFKHAIKNTNPQINGDGSITRDFTFVENVVKANINALYSKELSSHHLFNVALGKTTNLNDLWQMIAKIADSTSKPNYSPNRQGDILHSLADIHNTKTKLNYTELIEVEEGLKKTYKYYQNLFS